MENVVCEVCGLVVGSKTYTKHLKSHRNPKSGNKCHLCEKEFTSKYNLQYHLAHHLNARNYVCMKCPRAYNTAADLSQHEWTHEIANETLTCAQCGLQFQARNKFNKHMRAHQDEINPGKKKAVNPKECPECPGKFFLNLHEHRKVVHLGHRGYICIICNKSFGKKSGLDRHKLTVHEKSREFKCELCFRAFGERSLLQRHARTHTDKYQQAKIARIHNHRPKNLLYCAFCNTSIDDNKKHYEEVHSNLLFICDVCFKRFKSQKILERHVKVFHKIEKNFFCDFCAKGFAEKYQLKRHMIIHREKLEKIAAAIELKNAKQESFETESWSEDEMSEIPEVEVKIEIQHEKMSTSVEQVMVKEEMLSGDEKNYSRPFSQDLHREFEVESELNKKTNSSLQQKVVKVSAQAIESDLKNEIIKKMIKCRRCDELFDEMQDFEFHFSEMHKKSKAESQINTTCTICLKTFAKLQFLKLHIAAIHEKNLFECEICCKKFSFERAKIRHVEVIHNNLRKYKCDHCEKKFGTSTQLKEHKNYYHSTKPLDQKTHYCKICDKYYAQAKNLRQHHQSVHLGIKQKSPTEFKCKFCKEIFSNKYQKEKHFAQVHLNGVKLTRTCQLCSLDFKLFDDFKLHINSHQLPFMCLICGTSSLNKDAFSEHKANHRQVEMNLRQHQCDICGHKTFKRLQIMIHMRKHGHENTYVCDVCGAGYKYIAPFLYHKKAHEGKKDHICTHCGKGFISKQDMTVHIRSHTLEKPFKCSVCERKFRSKAILASHHQTHPETRKTLSCSTCSFAFADKKQAKMHDEFFHPFKLPFKCDKCGESFMHAHSLKSHQRHKHKPDKSIEIPMTETKNDSADLIGLIYNY